MCDPVMRMAIISESVSSKEDRWILDLQQMIKQRQVTIDSLDREQSRDLIERLDFEQMRDRKALTLLKIRKEKAEAAQ